MIVDLNDRSHLRKEILKDYEFLCKKHELILKKIQKKVGTKILKDDLIRNSELIEYHTPKNKTKWHISYRAYKNETIKEARFISIYEHIQNDKTLYLVLDSRNTEDVFLQIFNTHFVVRLAERSALSFKSNKVGIAQFVLGEEFRNTSKWKNSLNRTDDYQVNKWGLSLGEYDDYYKIFDNRTFISQKELFKDQNEDLRDHFLDSINLYEAKKYELLISSWSDYLDPLEMASIEMNSQSIGQKSNPAIEFLANSIFNK